ncbi:aspartate dehydrogenase domain-containing protein [Nocardia sp. NPDC050717]|uniref:aspartate dehydrogenase domain-containing protein n=1 Tax=Nocardia sp. NPDC050717 TaxID=3157221 RepID=UPI0033F849AC
MNARVAVLGYGSIGRVVAARLLDGALPGARLVAIVDQQPQADAPVPQTDLDDAIAASDVIVECAGQAVVAEHAERILAAGRDLLISSAGALVDPELARRLRDGGPGRVLCTSGAIGGLDLLAAAADAAPFETVTVRTTKKPAALVQPWMDAERATAIETASAPMTVFEGDAAEAARLFPRSLNVAAAVSFAVRDWDIVRVQLIAAPDADLTRHEITAAGPMGRYRFQIENLPSADNPRTSAVVPYAVLRSLATLLHRPALIG